jgi:hypothetical protein
VTAIVHAGRILPPIDYYPVYGSSTIN